MLVNIFSNAVKYTTSGGIKVKVTQKIVDDLPIIVIVVEDSGIGIKNLEKVGTWFNNLEIVDNVNQNGIGFGLSISQRII